MCLFAGNDEGRSHVAAYDVLAHASAQPERLIRLRFGDVWSASSQVKYGGIVDAVVLPGALSGLCIAHESAFAKIMKQVHSLTLCPDRRRGLYSHT